MSSFGYADPDLRRMLGDEEEDKRRFFAEELHGQTPWRTRADQLIPQSPDSEGGLKPTQSVTSVPSISTIPDVRQDDARDSWGGMLRSGPSAASPSRPAEDTKNTSVTSGSSLLAQLRADEAASAARKAAREARAQKEKEERERRKQEREVGAAAAQDRPADRPSSATQEEQTPEDKWVEVPATTSPPSATPSATAEITQEHSVVAPPPKADRGNESSTLPTVSTETSHLKTGGNNTSATQLHSTTRCQRCFDAEAAQRAAEAKAREADTIASKAQDELMRMRTDLDDAQDRVSQLMVERDLLHARLEGRDFRRDIGSGAIEMVSKEEMKKVRCEIEEQEKLFAALQFEDERKGNDIKALREQVKQLQQQLLESQQKRPVSPAPTPSVGPSQVVRELTKTANRLKEELRVRDEAHQLETEALVKAKHDLERRLAAVDWQKAQDDELRIRDLQNQLQRQKQDYEAVIKELQERVTWYVQNQDLLSRNDDLLRRQSNEIESLKSRVVELDTRGGKGKAPDQAKYIAEMQAKIKALEEIVRSKYPNSIPELIRACKPTESELETYRNMHERIKQLNQELADREAEYDKSLRTLRQEADKMSLDYQERVRTLQQEHKVSLRNVTTTKIKELEKKLTETREYYMKKVRDLEQQLLSLRKQAKKDKGDTKPRLARSTPPPTTTSGTSTNSIGMQTDPWEPQYRTDGSPASPSPRPSSDCTHHTVHLRAEVDHLQAALQQHRTENALLSQRLGGALAECERNAAQAQRYEEEARALKVSLEDAQRRFTSEVHQLQETHRNALQKQRLEWEADVARLEQAVERRSKQVIMAGSTKAERVQFLQVVADRLQGLEADYAFKESEMHRQIDEVRRVAEFELAVQKQKLNLIIQSKNNEIEKFRISLDALVNELERVKK